MAPSTPPSKRHHLPYLKQPSNPWSPSMNQLFVATCLISLVLQLFGSLASWTHVHQRELGLVSHALPNTHLSSSAATPTTSRSLKKVVEEEDDALSPPRHSGRLRVLIGILTADFFNDQTYRKRHRALFALWNDSRVCSLPDFLAQPLEERYDCQLVYTFVVGANPEAEPINVDDSRPMLVDKPAVADSPDWNHPDMTLLNIRENMNEGKSQTWLKYAARVAQQHDLDYVGKCDADALLHLHEFFVFGYRHLPPAPYNRHVYVGALRDKAYWPRHETEEERIRFESYFGNQFEGVHLYVAGQIYIMSTDLAEFVGKEALTSQCSYCEGHEDHDISAMAFHSPEPVKLVVIGRKQRFWEHPVKGEPRWRRMWAREQARMKGEPFEGKIFFKNSTLAAVLQGTHDQV